MNEAGLGMLRFIGSAFLCAGFALAEQPSADADVLIARLGSASFAEREEAQATLRNLGPAARGACERARAYPDPEVRSRVHALLASGALGNTTEYVDLRMNAFFARDFADDNVQPRDPEIPEYIAMGAPAIPHLCAYLRIPRGQRVRDNGFG